MSSWSIPAVALASGLLFAAACGGYKPPLNACMDGTPLDEEPCTKGSYVANDRCFIDRMAACGCINCPSRRCLVEEQEEDDEDAAAVTCSLGD